MKRSTLVVRTQSSRNLRPAVLESLEARRLLSINPTVVSTEFLVNTVQVNDQLGPAVTVLTNGNIVYAWETYGRMATPSPRATSAPASSLPTRPR